MYPVDTSDWLFYAVVSGALCALDPLSWHRALRKLVFCVLCLYLVTIRRAMPFPYRSYFSQQATTRGYFVVEYLRRAFAEGTGVVNCSSIRRLSRFRRARYAAHGLGDVEVFDHKDYRLFQSKSRKEKAIDLIVVYYHGGIGFGDGTGETYTEFITVLVVKLLEQGFTNPVISVSKYRNTEKYTTIQNLVPEYAHCRIVVASDSLGSCFALHNVGELAAKSEYQPAAMVLISPVVGQKPHCSNAGDDYITHEVLARWKKLLGPFFVTSSNYAPPCGWFVSYGSEELLAPAIQDFAATLAGPVKIDCQLAQVHNWPLVCFWTENTVYDREVGIESIAVHVSRTVLWTSQGYFKARLRPRVPPNLDESDI